ncbi:MAG: hypothetical protein IT536_06620, partial [Hyphomicrobiales bacterium]|nr:hypothetical protein [Hyphomicrobiales bacterium]
MVEHVDDWRAELDWIRAAGADGVILFENVSARRGILQDELRCAGFNVIGGCAFGDRLENDRAFAQEVLRDLGMRVCPVHAFHDRAKAIAFIAERPARYVVKFNGPSESYVGCFHDGCDVRAFLAAAPRQAESGGFILMEHVEGVETGVGAYFDGQEFLSPSCLDWEHKRFFPGDLGELTGEMGTVVTYHGASLLHRETLGRLAPLLRRHGYCGYINLNTIVNERGIWPLEFTCRFGYPGYAILDALQDAEWHTLFRSMIARSHRQFPVLPGFAVGIVLTTPPFPYCREDVPVPVGLPILIDGNLTDVDRRNLHYGEVSLRDGALVTGGAFGWTLVVTGVGASIRQAQQCAIALAERVRIPNVRYRRDIGDRLVGG